MKYVIDKALSSGDPLTSETFDKIFETRGYGDPTRVAVEGQITYEMTEEAFIEELDGIMADAREMLSPAECEVVNVIIDGSNLCYDTLLNVSDSDASMTCQVIHALGGAYAGWLWGVAFCRYDCGRRFLDCGNHLCGTTVIAIIICQIAAFIWGLATRES